jgi:hypothetical protein
MVSLILFDNPSTSWNTVAFLSVFAVPLGVVVAVIAAAAGVGVRNRVELQRGAHPVRRGVWTVAVIAFAASLLLSLLIAVDWRLIVLAAFVFAGVAAALATLVLRRPARS